MQELIIHKLKKGNREAFREVFNEHVNALSSFAFKHIQDTQAAQDMVQEVFISLWENRKGFEHPAAVKSFLYTSVKNKCLNHLKHEAVRRKHQDSLAYKLESDTYFTGQVIEEETFNKLYSEIQKLPRSASAIMILALNGLKNQEIADELQVSVNTVKTQKKIAYARLKDTLGPMLKNLLILITFG